VCYEQSYVNNLYVNILQLKIDLCASLLAINKSLNINEDQQRAPDLNQYLQNEKGLVHARPSPN